MDQVSVYQTIYFLMSAHAVLIYSAKNKNEFVQLFPVIRTDKASAFCHFQPTEIKKIQMTNILGLKIKDVFIYFGEIG